MTGVAPKSPLRRSNVFERRMTKFLHEPPSVRLAASVIVTATGLIVVGGGVLMRVFDHSEYGSIWLGMWWVLETVTTVGYGDVTPNNTAGYVLTAFVMLEGIAFLTIVTAAITSSFVARAQREGATEAAASMAAGDANVTTRLDGLDAHVRELSERIARLDELLRADPARAPGRQPGEQP
jgi:voltage-gated potassium channel